MNWHHIGIYVRELERSISFYQKHFGFSEEIRFQHEDEEIVFLTKGPIRIEFIQSETDYRSTEQIHFCWQVDELQQWVDRLDLNPIEGPMTLANGWKTVLYQGPDQEIVELFQG